MSNIKMVSTISPVFDPGAPNKRTDFATSHYDFTRVPEGIVIHSKQRPEADVTVVFAANVACLSVVAVAPPESPEADAALGLAVASVPKHQNRFQQGKRR